MSDHSLCLIVEDFKEKFCMIVRSLCLSVEDLKYLDEWPFFIVEDFKRKVLDEWPFFMLKHGRS